MQADQVRPRILVTGKDGQVGFALQHALGALGTVTAVGRADCDLTDPEAIRALVARVAPDIIVNPAAYTAVDRAEAEPAVAFAVNAQAPAILAQEAARRDALLVHYSTDYVFAGDAPGARAEDDPTGPKSVYGQSKLAGEEAVRASGCRHFILRTSWVFGAHGGNFLKTILRLAQERDALRIVADQTGSPTSAALIARVTAEVLRQYSQRRGDPGADALLGTYHLAAAGATSWHGYAQFAVAQAALRGMAFKLDSGQIAPIATAEYPLPAPRPANSLLDTRRLQGTFGLTLPEWQDDVIEVLNKLIRT
jgi:dTDP-4-dehydrorhamnose reductase